jgi:type I restriction enzyme S subunit
MSKSWKQTTLASVVDIISGGTPKTDVHEYWNGDIPWLSVSDFNTGYRWTNTAEKSITSLGLSKSATTVLNRGDIVISARGTVGVVAQLGKPMAFNQSCYGIRGKRGIADTNFIYYLLRYTVPSLKQVTHGAVFDTITRDTFEIIEICLPSLPEQRAIAHILGALDDKIELNRRMNETLEAMARALFKSWFVDFDPVHAKAEGRDPGLPADIAALFPDSFQDSELGEIPQGWRIGTLGDVAVSQHRSILPSDIDSETPYIALEHMPRKSIALADWDYSESIESGKLAFKKREILFGKLRPYFHKVGVAPLDGVCSTDIVVLTPRKGQWFGFVLEHASSAAFVEHANAGSTGTKMPRTSWSEMARYNLVTPPEKVAEAFTNKIRPMIDKIIANVHQSRTLVSLRDTLLPRLISGKIDVSKWNLKEDK